MKKINKSSEVPEILRRHKAPASVDDIDRKVYTDYTVKESLLRNQSHQCAYCECYLEGPFADVEHYRPQRTYRQSPESPHKPGYYWLAYDWSNLLVSCNTCNRILKNDLFPLADEFQRDILHQDISKEQPLIINPAVDDPSLHLTYHEHMVSPVMHEGVPDVMGTTTVELFQLNNRVALVDARRRRWEEFMVVQRHLSLSEKLLHNPDVSEEVKDTARELAETSRRALQTFTSPDSVFSGMIQAYINNVASI